MSPLLPPFWRDLLILIRFFLILDVLLLLDSLILRVLWIQEHIVIRLQALRELLMGNLLVQIFDIFLVTLLNLLVIVIHVTQTACSSSCRIIHLRISRLVLLRVSRMADHLVRVHSLLIARMRHVSSRVYISKVGNLMLVMHFRLKVIP